MKDKTKACEEQWAKADLKINTQDKGQTGGWSDDCRKDKGAG